MYKVKQASISCSIKETESIHMTFIVERINEFEIFYGLEEMSRETCFSQFNEIMEIAHRKCFYTCDYLTNKIGFV